MNAKGSWSDSCSVVARWKLCIGSDLCHSDMESLGRERDVG